MKIKYTTLVQDRIEENVKTIDEINPDTVTQVHYGSIDSDKLINNVHNLMSRVGEKRLKQMKVGDKISVVKVTTEIIFIEREE
jgi:hypothetical protein